MNEVQLTGPDRTYSGAGYRYAWLPRLLNRRYDLRYVVIDTVIPEQLTLGLSDYLPILSTHPISEFFQTRPEAQSNLRVVPWVGYWS